MAKQIEDYYKEVISAKCAVTGAISKAKPKIEEAHKKYLKALLRYYESIRISYIPLMGQCYVEYDYTIDGIKYPAVYCIITGTSSYQLDRFDSRYENPREITTKSASGFSIDDSYIFKLPVIYICIDRIKDKTLKWSSRELVDGLRFGELDFMSRLSPSDFDNIVISCHNGYVDVPSQTTFFAHKTKINSYQFDFIFSLYDRYSKKQLESDIEKLRLKINRAFTINKTDDMGICFICDPYFHTNIFDEDVDVVIDDILNTHIKRDSNANIRKSIKEWVLCMDADDRNYFAQELKRKGIPLNLSNVEDYSTLETVEKICEEVMGALDYDSHDTNEEYEENEEELYLDDYYDKPDEYYYGEEYHDDYDDDIDDLSRV